jgi:hypothetical protein
MTAPVPPPITRDERRWLLWSTAAVLAASLLPYLLCALAAYRADVTFTGLLLNPPDGFTYLAKMRMGLEGHWLYHLPFTLERGPGAFLFTYYFALGHAARLVDLPLPVMFHVARLLGGALFLWTLYRAIACIADDVRMRKLMWWLVAFGSGLGWVVLKFGLGYSYYYQQVIAYASLFYGLVANAHFALALALMLMLFMQILGTKSMAPLALVKLSVVSLALAIVIPFMPVVVYLVTGVGLLVVWRRDRRMPRAQLASILVAGAITGGFLVFMQMQINADPTFTVLSTQAKTPTPGPLGMLLSYGLLWPFALVGMYRSWQRRSDWDVVLLTWVLLVLPLSYIPYHMQWRFLLGLQIPIAVFAAEGIVCSIRAIWMRRAAIAATMLSSVYLVLFLIVSKAPVATAAVHFPLTYLSADETAALRWLRTDVPIDAAVLASREMNFFIPAYAGQRVVAGHGVETFDAPRKSKLVIDFFAGTLDRAALLRELPVDHLVVGPRDLARGTFDPATLPLRLEFSAGGVAVYKVERTQAPSQRESN